MLLFDVCYGTISLCLPQVCVMPMTFHRHVRSLRDNGIVKLDVLGRGLVIAATAIKGEFIYEVDKYHEACEVTIYLYYYRRAVRKNLSPKFGEFLAVQSQFDSDHGIDFYAHTHCQSTIFGPLFAFYCPLFFTKK